jgi:hypothetical protein
MSAIENDTSERSAMNTKDKLLNLLLREKELPAEMKTKIDVRVAEFWEGIIEDAGLFLCENLDDKTHTQDEVKTLVQCVPGSLSYLNAYATDYDYEQESFVLPIQSAFLDKNASKSISFIPLLAEEGFKLNVGGDGMRGGLLCENDVIYNALVECCWGRGRDFDSVCLNVMKRLREMDLLKKEDINEYRLLSFSMHVLAERRFEYLVDWDPAALKECYESSLGNSINNFKLAIKAGIKYFPQDIGHLAFQYMAKYKHEAQQQEKDEAWKMIRDCLDEADPNKILKKNQDTNLYPFMTAAEGSRCYLDVVYYLLRKDPSVLGNCDDNEKPAVPTVTICTQGTATGKRKHT